MLVSAGVCVAVYHSFVAIADESDLSQLIISFYSAETKPIKQQQITRQTQSTTPTAAIAAVGLPSCLFLFYAAIKKGEYETEQDDLEYNKPRGRL